MRELVEIAVGVIFRVEVELKVRRYPGQILKLALFATPLLLNACASVPYGEFNGKNVSPSSPDTHDVAVVWVDGQLVFDSSTKPIGVGANVSQRLALGRHELQVRPLVPGNAPLLSLTLNVQPCTRYNFVAKDAGGTFNAVAVGEIPIPGCKR